MKKIRAFPFVVCVLVGLAGIGSSVALAAHTSPERFYEGALDNSNRTRDPVSWWRKGHRHNVTEVSARAVFQANTVVCVNAIEDSGSFATAFACTSSTNDLAVHGYCGCAWRYGYVDISSAGSDAIASIRAQEKF